jgi:acyl-CoA reductase-like NAD-dependent aldehyde dehydrogenase
VRVEGYISAGNAEGARLVVGGGRPKELPVGYYVEPTLFIDVDNGSKIAREEIFGPVLCVIAYATEEEAIALANSSTYGLAGSVFSKDVDRALAVALRIDTGSVTVNGYRNAPNVPIGGHRDSGLGQQGGLEGFLTYRQYTSIALP